MTFKPRTHYEQVPLEIVKQIARVDEPDEVTNSMEAKRKTEEVNTAESVADSANEFKFTASAFDIFQMEDDGSVLWQELAATMEEAKARVNELQALIPRQFMIVSLRSGEKLIINPDAPCALPKQDAPLDSCGQC